MENITLSLNRISIHHVTTRISISVECLKTWYLHYFFIAYILLLVFRILLSPSYHR